MKLDELKQYTRLKSDEIFYEVEIARLKELKNEKVSYYSSPQLNAPSGSSVSSSTERIALINLEYAEKIETQIKEYTQCLADVRKQIDDIIGFINSVENAETKSMLRRHILQRVSFNQIANEHFVSRNYVAIRIKGVCN